MSTQQRSPVDQDHRARVIRHIGAGSRVGVLAVLLLTTAYFALPLWWLLVSSTKSSTALLNSNGFWLGGSFRLFANIQGVFTKDRGLFTVWLLNSILYAVVGGGAATLLGAACGYALAKLDFPGRSVLFGVIIAGVLLPSALLTVPLYLLFSTLHLVNSYASVLIPAAVSPFAVYLCRIYASASIPDEIIEAARVDAAGEIRIFLTLGLRLMSPALVTVFLFSFVGIWNNFFLPLVMLNDSRRFPVTLGLYNWFKEQGRVPYETVITGSLLSVVPLLVAFIALQRFWQSGLTAGAVKS